MAQSVKQSVDPIAIISVHGVADQLPYDSARQIAKLLLNHDINGDRPYQSFIEKEFYIPESREFKGLPILDEPNQGESELNSDEQTALSDISYNFLLKQLTPKKSSASLGIFKSLRLEGERQFTKSQASFKSDEAVQPIHIYEMYWADLSRLQNEFVRVFGEFYQILFHLSRVGRRSVEQLNEELEQTDSILWKGYRNTQRWAEQCLTLGIPILNVLMLVTAFVMVPLSLNEAQLKWVAIGSVAVASLILLGEVLWRSPDAPFAGFRKAKSLGCMIAIIFAAICASFDHLGLYHYISVLSIGILSLIAFVGIRKYNERRPNAEKAFLKAGATWMALFLGFIGYSSNEPTGIIWACLRTIELTFIPLVLVWLLFNGSQIVAALLGLLLTCRTKKPQRSKVWRGSWTARLSLALPSALFLLVTLTLWYAIAKVSHDIIPSQTPYRPLIPTVFLGEDIQFANDFAEKLIVAAATSSFVIVLAIVSMALLIGIFVLLPSIGAEIFRTYDENPEITQRFERWLTRGLKGLYGITELINVTMVAFSIWSILLLILRGLQILPIESVSSVATQIFQRFTFFNQLSNTNQILGLLSLVVVSSATSLIALGSRLAKFTSGIRNLLDVVLDVDSYLRMNPKGYNPKSQIFSRYLSLLRYICNWSDTEQSGQKYSAIIIIAHSQGTVITADILRFLQRFLVESHNDASLSRLTRNYPSRDTLPIYLYTMGSPLKQLYSFAFPSLYHWMDDLKDLDSFGLKYWLNVYCTGDYVGRSLWKQDQGSLPTGFQEEILGAGAHTHYWDSTSPKIAKYLDNLISAHIKHQSRSQIQGRKNSPDSN